MRRRRASRASAVPNHCGGSRAAEPAGNTVFVALEPQNSVLSRLRQAFRANPSATRFILHGQNHPGFEELLTATESFPVSVVGIPVRDTCKEVVDGIIQRTVPREALVDAVGPWIFSRQGLEGLLSRIQGNGERIASLADLAEAVPARVRVLTGPWQTSSVWPPP